MGGISVLVVLGLFMSFYALYLFLIFISIFYLVENYIFESLFLYNKTHSKKLWIPYYSKYLLGKEVALEKEGLFLMMIEIMGTILLSLFKCSIRFIRYNYLFIVFRMCFTFFYYEYLYFTSNYKKGLS